MVVWRLSSRASTPAASADRLDVLVLQNKWDSIRDILHIHEQNEPQNRCVVMTPGKVSSFCRIFTVSATVLKSRGMFDQLSNFDLDSVSLVYQKSANGNN